MAFLPRAAEAGSNATPVTTETAGTTNEAEAEPARRWVEETRRVWIVDQEAWSEQLPVYEMRERSICSICGADITGATFPHSKQHILAGEDLVTTARCSRCRWAQGP